MKNQMIGINGMSCMNCVGKVEKAVSEMKGAENIVVDLKGKYMTFDMDENLTTVAAVKEKVASLGFEATEAPKVEKKSTGLLGKLLKR